MTTRFRPTPTGDLHCGHVHVILPNHELAKRGGDPFLLIIDDINANLQDVWKWQAYPAVIAGRFAEDLRWLGMEPDAVLYSSTNAEAHAEAAEKLGIARPGLVTNAAFDIRFIRDSSTGGPVDGYHEWLILTRVVDDHEFGVQYFARGRDLIGERQLYDHLWRRLYPAGQPPLQAYLPTVRRELSPAKLSTTAGDPSIRQLRAAGYSAREIIDTVRECARVSGLAGLADVVIPEGVLTVETHKALRWQEPELNARSIAESMKGKPQGAHVAAQLARQLRAGA